MSGIWTASFWKDAVERLGTTLVSILIGAVATEDFGWAMLHDWKFWSPIVIAMAVNLLKVLAAGLAKPNTGASFGTAVPTDQTKAIVDMTKDTPPGTVIDTQTEQPVEVVPQAA